MMDTQNEKIIILFRIFMGTILLENSAKKYLSMQKQDKKWRMCLSLLLQEKYYQIQLRNGAKLRYMIEPIKTYNVVDKEYNERIKAAKGTNLIADEPNKYFVPFNMVVDLYLKFLDAIDDGDCLDDLDKTVLNEIKAKRDQIDSSIVKLNFVADEEVKTTTKTKTKTKAIDICPYCGEKMTPITGKDFRNRNNVSIPYVTFACFNCGASSPSISFKNNMIDEDKLKEEILFAIHTTYNLTREEEENDNGREEDE